MPSRSQSKSPVRKGVARTGLGHVKAAVMHLTAARRIAGKRLMALAGISSSEATPGSRHLGEGDGESNGTLTNRTNTFRMGLSARKQAKERETPRLLHAHRQLAKILRNAKLVPREDDLSREESHVVEVEFSKYGPIDTKLKLMEFMTILGENVTEDVLTMLLNRVLVVKDKEEKEILEHLKVIDALAASRLADVLHESNLRRQQMDSQDNDDDDARDDIDSGGGSVLSPPGSPDVGSRKRSISFAAANSEGSPPSMSVISSRLDKILVRDFLRPFFSLEDILRLLHEIKIRVLKNRLRRDDVKEVFDALCDTSHEAIDAEEFRIVAKTFNLQMDVDAVLEEIDEDGSGKIELDEFRHLLGRVGVGKDDGDDGRQSSASPRDDAGDDDLFEELDAYAPAATAFAVITQQHQILRQVQRASPAAASLQPLAAYTNDTGSSGERPTPLCSPLTAVLLDGNRGDEGELNLVEAGPGPALTPLMDDALSPQDVSHSPMAGSLSLKRLPPTDHRRATRGPTTGSELATLVESRLKAVKKQLNDVSPLDGIEPTRVVASYLALQSSERSPIRVRLTKKAANSFVKKNTKAKAHQRSPSPQGGVNKRPEPSRHESTSSNSGGTTALTVGTVAQSGALPSIVKQAVPEGGLSSNAEAIRSTAFRKLPPLLRPGRHHFRVEQSLSPSWTEPYHLYMRPF